jgi:hypothetical protein
MSTTKGETEVYFLVKVRVDISKMAEFGKRIVNSEFDNSSIKSTFCLKNDPTVGYSIWETKDEAEFDKKFDPYTPYYKEVEIFPVVLPTEAQELIMKQFAK